MAKALDRVEENLKMGVTMGWKGYQYR